MNTQKVIAEFRKRFRPATDEEMKWMGDKEAYASRVVNLAMRDVEQFILQKLQDQQKEFEAMVEGMKLTKAETGSLDDINYNKTLDSILEKLKGKE